MNEYVCNKCGTVFKVSKFKMKNLPDSRIDKFIQCSKCKKKYHIIFENEESLELDVRLSKAFNTAFKYARGSEEFKKYYNEALLIKTRRQKILKSIN